MNGTPQLKTPQGTMWAATRHRLQLTPVIGERDGGIIEQIFSLVSAN